ncbi:similar to An12g00400 [Aspergillus luchuensis]|uniref:Similar to An12g00400 n=1 Tax=Aspergillus kawachii TaxID=1069201 RepID=A0A146EY90_ASPKA|nr:similar to An12g00400 [Aspergillus luchuensis]
MRYEDWDVILFPESSKVPIQEFKTQCFVTKDKGQCRRRLE